MTAVILTLILLPIAALHIAWGFGYWWPIRDEAALTRAVLGNRGATEMPSALACALVALALITAVWWIWFALPVMGLGLWRVGLGLMAAIFVARGAISYVPASYAPAFVKEPPEQPFDRLNRRYYSPLCLLVGAGFAIILLKGAL